MKSSTVWSLSDLLIRLCFFNDDVQFYYRSKNHFNLDRSEQIIYTKKFLFFLLILIAQIDHSISFLINKKILVFFFLVAYSLLILLFPCSALQKIVKKKKKISYNPCNLSYCNKIY